MKASAAVGPAMDLNLLLALDPGAIGELLCFVVKMLPFPHVCV